jgi:predicted esterase
MTARRLMNTNQWIKTIGFITASLLAAGLVISGCGPTLTPLPVSTATLPPTSTPVPTPLPTLSLDETSAKEFVITDFDAVHSPVNGDANEHLIFGNIPVSKPAANLPPELAVFLGRWEGYDYSPPVKKDRKVVLVIQEITAQGGRAFGWSGTNLQFPDTVGEINFRVVPGDSPSLEWQFVWLDGSKHIATFTFDRDENILRGWLDYSSNPSGPIKLSRDRSFYVYKDYVQYLAGKRIHAQEYQNKDLQQYGQGYLLYLPEGYEADFKKTWPLIFFLHGMGDRGDNMLLLAKASPFMFIREKGPLPFIIAAPLLNTSQDPPSFPEAYMDGVLAKVQKDYRVDPKRIYVTGLSMGGEATWRFALHQPDAFAAIAPLSAYLNHSDALTMKSIQELPVWAIHGAEDTVIPLTRAQQPVEALKEVGGNVKFSVLEGHDHDVWTDTYSDPAFYNWLLQYHRP